MKKIMVNGYGWTGSSAFIDLLNNISNKNFCVIPDEFDDFRFPGAMRNALENSNLPVSKRTSSKKLLLKYFIRGQIPDFLWPNWLKGKNISKKKSLVMYKNFSSEKKIFEKYAKLIYKSPIGFDKEKILKSWINEVLNFYKESNPQANTFFIEQFFLFDDEYKLYKWLDFDKLILFIRDPYYQLQSTLESKILYSDYPWQAQFLIGGGSKFDLRKFELFIETTKLRYQWIINFLKNYKKDQIIIVDFDNFLNNYDQTIKFLSKILEIDLQHKSKFNIMDSRKRNKKWQTLNYILDFKLNLISKSYLNFKKDLSKIATTMN